MNAQQKERALVALGFMSAMGAVDAESVAVIAARVNADTLTAVEETELLSLVDHTEVLGAAATLLPAPTP